MTGSTQFTPPGGNCNGNSSLQVLLFLEKTRRMWLIVHSRLANGVNECEWLSQYVSLTCPVMDYTPNIIFLSTWEDLLRRGQIYGKEPKMLSVPTGKWELWWKQRHRWAAQWLFSLAWQHTLCSPCCHVVQRCHTLLLFLRPSLKHGEKRGTRQNHPQGAITQPNGWVAC